MSLLGPVYRFNSLSIYFQSLNARSRALLMQKLDRSGTTTRSNTIFNSSFLLIITAPRGGNFDPFYGKRVDLVHTLLLVGRNVKWVTL